MDIALSSFVFSVGEAAIGVEQHTHTIMHVGFIPTTISTNTPSDPITSPPSVVITTPTPGGVIISTSFLASGTAEDSQSQTDGIEIFVDGLKWDTLAGGTGTVSWSYSWNVSLLNDGTHQFRVRATNQTGVYSQAISSVILNLETFDIPLGGIRAVPNVFNPSLSSTTITFILSEPVQIATVTIGGVDAFVGTNLPAGVNSFEWGGSGLGEGQKNIVVSGKSFAGETDSATKANAVRIDNDSVSLVIDAVTTQNGNTLVEANPDLALHEDSVTINYTALSPGTSVQRRRRVFNSANTELLTENTDPAPVLELEGAKAWIFVTTAATHGVYRFSISARKPPPMPSTFFEMGGAFAVVASSYVASFDNVANPVVTVLHPQGVSIGIAKKSPNEAKVADASKALVSDPTFVPQSTIYDITGPPGTSVIVLFRYDPVLFGGGGNVQTIQLRRWSGTAWVETDSAANLIGQFVDETNNMVVAHLTQLSLYALMSQVEGQAPTVSNVSGDPFSPNGDGRKETTFIRYTLSDNSPSVAATVQIFSSTGALVRTLTESDLRLVGMVTEFWDGRDDAGAIVPQGVYTIKVKAVDASGNESAEQSGTVTADLTAPSPITTLAASPGDLTGEVRLRWTAIGDDQSNTNAFYFIKVATHVITDANFNSASVQNISPPPPAPASAGTSQSTVVTGLSPNTEYFFGMKVEDQAGNRSGVSNSPSALARGVGSPIRMNEIAPSEPGGADKVEIFVATSATYSGYRLYEVANAIGSEFVKSFPSTGAWASPLPAGTLIVLNFNSASADETTITNNVINIYTTDAGLRATDNVLMLSDSGGISFSEGIYQSGAITDFVTWANQDDVNYVNQQGQMIAAINAAVSQGEWTKLGTTPIQFDAVNSRGLDGAAKAISRNEASSDAGLPAKHDWSYRTTTTIGATNGASTTISGDGSASLSPQGPVTAGLTNTNWTITYTNSSSANDNIGHMVSIDIPSGWSAPQTSNPSGVGFTTTTFQFTQDYEITISQNKIILPVGNLANGEGVSIQYKNATVQSSSGTAQFLVSSDQTGTNVGPLASGSPSVAVSGDTIAPSSITTLAAQTGQNTGEVNLSWISPGDDGTIGTATLYIVRYASGAQITESNFAQATDVPNEPAPLVSGTAQSMLVTGLAPNVTYFFALKTQDEAANTSSISNSPSSEAKPEILIATHVVISEVSPGTTQASFEYVELYNPTTAAILLQGNVKLKMTTGTGDSLQTKTLTWLNSSIPSHGFFLFASTSPISGVTADATFSAGLTGNDGVMLTNNSDVSIDRVAWGNGGAGDIPTATENTRISSATNLSTGDSIERKANANSTSSSMLPGGQDNLRGNGYDTDNNNNDFVIHIGTFFPQNSGSIEGSPAFTATLEPTEITLTPPQHGTMDLVIANLDSEDDFFDLDIKTALATTWYTLPPNLMVKAGSTERQSIQITIPANVTFPEDTLFPIEVQVKHQCSPSHAQRHEPSSDFRVSVYGEVLVKGASSARLRVKKNISKSGGGALHRAGAQITFSTASLAQDTLIEIIQEDVSNPTEETRKSQSQSQLGLKSAGLGFEFYPEGLSFASAAEITLSYEDANLSGPHDFLVYYWNPKLLTWEEEFTLLSDTESKRITAKINHFSLYRVFAKPHKTTSAPPQNAAPVYTDFSQSRCYPTPIKMGSGGQFDASHITMDKLPVGTIAEVYTINGEKICNLGPSEGSTLTWDCKNAEGNHVGPGIYLCPLLAPNGQKKTDVMVVE